MDICATACERQQSVAGSTSNCFFVLQARQPDRPKPCVHLPQGNRGLDLVKVVLKLVAGKNFKSIADDTPHLGILARHKTIESLL